MISPGLTVLRWISLNLEAYVDSVVDCLKSLELLIDRGTDLWEIQIKGNLEALQNSLLCDLPENNPWTPDEFVAKTQVNVTLFSVVNRVCMFKILYLICA